MTKQGQGDICSPWMSFDQVFRKCMFLPPCRHDLFLRGDTGAKDANLRQMLLISGSGSSLSISRSLLPQKTQKIYRSRFALVKKIELGL